MDKCFSRDTVEEIIDTLVSVNLNLYDYLIFITKSYKTVVWIQNFQDSSEAGILRDEWCTSTLKKLKEACPLTLKVSLRSVSLFPYSIFLISTLLSWFISAYITLLFQIREGHQQIILYALFQGTNAD